MVNPPVIKPTINLKLADNSDIPISENVDIILIPENYIDVNTLENRTEFRDGNLQLRMFYEVVLERLVKSEFSVDQIEHHQYHEYYHFKVQNKIHSLRFYYNSKYHFKKPRTSDKMEDEIISLIFSNIEINYFPENFLKCFYEIFRTKLQSKNIGIQSVEHNNYADIYTLVRSDEILICTICYTADQFFTTVMITKVNSENILIDFKAIIKTKLL